MRGYRTPLRGTAHEENRKYVMVRQEISVVKAALVGSRFWWSESAARFHHVSKVERGNPPSESESCSYGASAQIDSALGNGWGYGFDRDAAGEGVPPHVYVACDCSAQRDGPDEIGRHYARHIVR